MVNAYSEQRYSKCPTCGEKPPVNSSSAEHPLNSSLPTGERERYVTCPKCGRTYLDP
jgi:endogenous inhibitor of DNA gyrase (YacG/DUF329 family)